VKPANQFGVTVAGGGALSLLGLGAKPLGLPSFLGVFLLLTGILVLIEASYRLKRAKVRGPDPHGTIAPDASVRARVRYYWLAAFALVLVSVLLIPILPYTVDNYNPKLLYAVIPGQIFVVTGFLLYLRRRLFSDRSPLDR
jgi:hypothetical protein